MWSKIEKKIFQIEAFIITAALAIMFIAVVVQVFVRMLGMNSVGTTEIGMLMMSLLTFIGTSAIVYTKDHISIELEQMLKSERLKHGMKIISTGIMIIFGVVFLSVTYNFFTFILESGQKTIELDIPMTIPVGSMVVGAFLLIIHSISDIIGLLKKKDNNNQSNDVVEGGN